MKILRWRSLDARLRGRRIAGLRYDPEAGFVVVELADGGELWVSADWEGCQVFESRDRVGASRVPSADPGGGNRPQPAATP